MRPLYTLLLLSLVVAASTYPVRDIRLWPWQGSISKRFDFVCGCTLISHEWAVTAASCVQSPPYEVRFGSLDRTEGIVRTVEEVVVHENYTTSGSYKYNDIAVLKFAPLQQSFSLHSIKLGETEETGNDHCYFTGWGFDGIYDIDYPFSLHESHPQIELNSKCDDYWPNIDESHVCTEPQDTYGNPQAPCQGDEGGPLVCHSGNHYELLYVYVFVPQGDEGGPLVCHTGTHYELVGIYSWKSGRCDKWSKEPVFTRVAHFRQWIEDKTRI